MKVKKKIFIMLFFILIFLTILSRDSYASLKWNALDYDVTLNSDGSMNVVETWNIYISNTNTLFKDFDMMDGIVDTKVSLVEAGEEKPLKQIYEEQRHVDSNCFYSLPIDDNKFEIAWNVGLDTSKDTRTYKLYYKIENAVGVFTDCTEFYWMFLGTDNQIPGENITGTIHLPSKVSNIEKLRVWAHGDLTGEIERVSEDTVKFSLPKLAKEKMLEIRVVTEENIYPESQNKSSLPKLQTIIQEEENWANEANEERNRARKDIYVLIVVNIVIALIFFLKIKKYINEEKTIKEKLAMPKYELEYFRDIPDEVNATPARAMYISEYKNSYSYLDFPKVFSATLLDLCLKEFVQFEMIDDKNIKISINRNKEISNLSEDEAIIYNLVSDAIGNNESISIKEFEKYSEKNYEKVYAKVNSITPAVEKYERDNEKIDAEKEKISKKYGFKSMLYFVFFVFSCFMYFLIKVIPAFYIGLLVALFYCSKISSKISCLTEKGYKEQVEWNALKSYMKDYSLLKEKKVPDIVLWEKFLVYATAFGISKEVIKQLKVAHPEMFNTNNSEYNIISNYGYWHLICNNNFENNVFDSFSKGMENIYNKAESAYNIAHSSSSSGSGSGGGFSSGGGGRRRRRRLRRSLK